MTLSSPNSRRAVYRVAGNALGVMFRRVRLRAVVMLTEATETAQISHVVDRRVTGAAIRTSCLITQKQGVVLACFAVDSPHANGCLVQSLVALVSLYKRWSMPWPPEREGAWERVAPWLW